MFVPAPLILRCAIATLLAEAIAHATLANWPGADKAPRLQLIDLGDISQVSAGRVASRPHTFVHSG